MSSGPLFEKIDHRVALDREEGDIAYFHVLALQLEYFTKLVTAGVLACIADDADRHRYTLEHKLVRADSLGDWVDVLNTAVTGPAAQCFLPQAKMVVRHLNERVGQGDWRYSAVCNLQAVAQRFGMESQVGAKASLRQLFQIGAQVRNRTRGHGAPTSTECGQVCPLLSKALAAVAADFELFRLPWAYLHRNLSGKFRVSPLLGECAEFDYLKRTRDVALPNGVYIYPEQASPGRRQPAQALRSIRSPVFVPLVFSDPDLADILVPNGNFKDGTFEALSYITNDVVRKDGTLWSNPPGRLPASESEGRPSLEEVGNTFANFPPVPVGHVPRCGLENLLCEELTRTDRHPIVSLTGSGGIGKTTLAIAAITSIANLETSPYDVVLWLSARDIDLLDSGPKRVAPRVVTKKDIARAAVELLEPSNHGKPDFNPEGYVQVCFAQGAAGPTLFVFDNFETVESPADVFAWIDTHVRPPNKVLITTRARDFVGDYPIEIGGMTDDEALDLIDQHAKRLGVETLLQPSYKEELIRESDGHPYVIKILLGQVAKERRAVKLERIVASADHLLKALFERTYDKLSPASQRVFLLLCSWRVFVPAVAVEAVLLRPGNERFDVATALSELRRFSLVEEVLSGTEDEVFVGVPLAAATFGRRKLGASALKVAVEEDRKVLMEFGAGKREDAHRGVLPRIERLVKTIATKVSANPKALDEFVPVLDYIASRIPKAYELLADLVLEVGDTVDSRERAKRYLQRFLEVADVHEKRRAWRQLADLCRASGDVVGEVHALAESALLPIVPLEEIGAFANQINNRIYELRRGQGVDEAWSPEVRLLIEKAARSMDRHIGTLSATDCSRLAWMYLNSGNSARAMDVARIGIQRDPQNEHCQKLLLRLES